VAHQRDLFLGKAAREIQVAELVELTDLFGGQLHAVPPANDRSAGGATVLQTRRCGAPILWPISARQPPKRTRWDQTERISRNGALSQQKCGFLAFLKGFGLM
jgi:hypothetical protein